MAVFIKDILGLGLRRVIWSLLIVGGCIDYALAVPLTKAVIAAASASDSHGGVVDGSLYRFTKDTADVKLTCTPTGDVGGSTPYRFLKDGEEFAGSWQAGPTKTLATYVAASGGNYSCEARDADSTTATTKKSDPITLTLVCTSAGGQCGDDKVFTCDTTAHSGKEFCRCNINSGGVFPAGCDTCDASKDVTPQCGANAKCEGTPKACVCTYANAGKPKECAACNATSCGDNAVCEGTPKKCACGPYGGTHPDCNACKDDKGCDTAGKTPRCEKPADKPAKCAKCNDAFCKTIKGKEVCDAKEGNCKAKDKTSDSATVTSTACLVIASVVVALMN